MYKPSGICSSILEAEWDCGVMFGSSKVEGEDAHNSHCEDKDKERKPRTSFIKLLYFRIFPLYLILSLITEMALIAVAGGSGNVGRKLVEAIVATGKHEVKILARKVRTIHTFELPFNNSSD